MTAKERIDNMVKEFEENCVKDLESAGFYEAMSKIMVVASALKDKSFSFNMKIEHSNFEGVKVSKRGPDFRVHRIV